jgi:hypothetical protein
MATKVYTSINGYARRVRKVYCSISGQARKVKKAYVGINGFARQFYTAATYQPGQVIVNTTASGVFAPTCSGIFRVCLVGSGGKGASGSATGGASGGGGAGQLIIQNINLKEGVEYIYDCGLNKNTTFRSSVIGYLAEITAYKGNDGITGQGVIGGSGGNNGGNDGSGGSGGNGGRIRYSENTSGANGTGGARERGGGYRYAVTYYDTDEYSRQVGFGGFGVARDVPNPNTNLIISVGTGGIGGGGGGDIGDSSLHIYVVGGAGGGGGGFYGGASGSASSNGTTAGAGGSGGSGGIQISFVSD